MAVAVKEHDIDVAGKGDARPEFRCRACGYGIVVRVVPSRCPMCRADAWQSWPEVAVPKSPASTESASSS
jgi:hypothetical protein